MYYQNVEGFVKVNLSLILCKFCVIIHFHGTLFANLFYYFHDVYIPFDIKMDDKKP